MSASERGRRFDASATDHASSSPESRFDRWLPCLLDMEVVGDLAVARIKGWTAVCEITEAREELDIRTSMVAAQRVSKKNAPSSLATSQDPLIFLFSVIAPDYCAPTSPASRVAGKSTDRDKTRNGL